MVAGGLYKSVRIYYTHNCLGSDKNRAVAIAPRYKQFLFWSKEADNWEYYLPDITWVNKN